MTHCVQARLASACQIGLVGAEACCVSRSMAVPRAHALHHVCGPVHSQGSQRRCEPSPNQSSVGAMVASAPSRAHSQQFGVSRVHPLWELANAFVLYPECAYQTNAAACASDLSAQAAGYASWPWVSQTFVLVRAVFLRFAAGKFTATELGPLWWLSANPEITSFGTGALPSCVNNSTPVRWRQISLLTGCKMHVPVIASTCQNAVRALGTCASFGSAFVCRLPVRRAAASCYLLSQLQATTGSRMASAC